MSNPSSTNINKKRLEENLKEVIKKTVDNVSLGNEIEQQETKEIKQSEFHKQQELNKVNIAKLWSVLAKIIKWSLWLYFWLSAVSIIFAFGTAIGQAFNLISIDFSPGKLIEFFSNSLFPSLLSLIVAIIFSPKEDNNNS